MKQKFLIFAALMMLAVLSAVPAWAASDSMTVTVTMSVNSNVGIKINANPSVSITVDPASGTPANGNVQPEIWYFYNNPSNGNWSATATATEFPNAATYNISVNQISVTLTDIGTPTWAPVTYTLSAGSPVTIKSGTTGWSGWKKSSHQLKYTPTGNEMYTATPQSTTITYTMTGQ